MMPEGVATGSRDDGAAGRPWSGGMGGSPSDPPLSSVWAMGVAADAVGPLEWWPTRRLRPYAPRHVKLPTFRDTPSWAILRHLVKEAGVREPLLVLPDGQVVDGAHRLELARALALPEVPVRVLTVPKRLGDEDRTILESSTIIEYLELKYPGPAPMIPANTDAALKVRMMDRIFDNYVMTPMQRFTFDLLRPAESRDPYGVQQARDMLIHAFAGDVLNRIRIDGLRKSLEEHLLSELPTAGGAANQS